MFLSAIDGRSRQMPAHPEIEAGRARSYYGFGASWYGTGRWAVTDDRAAGWFYRAT
jgi:hypothetical protein